MQYNLTRKTPGKHLKLTRKPCIYYEKYTRNIPEISGITCKLQVFPPETGVSVKYWFLHIYTDFLNTYSFTTHTRSPHILVRHTFFYKLSQATQAKHESTQITSTTSAPTFTRHAGSYGYHIKSPLP